MQPSAGVPSLVVFDLDGTLVDSIGDLVVAVNRLVTELGGRPLDPGRVARMVGEGAALLVSRAFEAARLEGDPGRALQRFLEIYQGLLPGTTRPYPGVPEMLAAVGRVAPLAVLTNKPGAPTRAILSALGLAPRFRAVVAGDSPFGRKPDPGGLLHLAELVGAGARDTVVVGDSAIDLLTARAAGARVCLARYGFGFDTIDRAALRGDEMIADSPADVARLVAGRAHGA